MSIYKGNKLVAGGSIDTHFVRKPVWNQTVDITAEQLYAGYAAPSDGMFVCSGVLPPGGSTSRTITVNGIAIVEGWYSNNTSYSCGDTIATVSKGDLIKANLNSSWAGETRYFVPFEDSTVSDVEVVTPELIRNLHDPDWSHAIAITPDQLSVGWTAPKRGIFIGSTLPKDNPGVVSITLNGVPIAFGSFSPNALYAANVSAPAAAHDVIKSDSLTLQDIYNIIHFVPYKAQ